MEAELQVAHGTTARTKREVARKLLEITAAHEAELADLSSRADAQLKSAQHAATQADARHRALQGQHAATTAAHTQLQRESDRAQREHEQRAADLEQRLTSAERSRAELSVSVYDATSALQRRSHMLSPLSAGYLGRDRATIGVGSGCG